MSTVVSTYLQDRASGKRISTEMNVDCTPKAFCAWNSLGTPVIRTSFNVSSLSDDAVGQWTPILTAVFATTPALAGASHNAGLTFNFLSPVPTTATGMTCASYPLGSTTATDASHVDIIGAGRLA